MGAHTHTSKHAMVIKDVHAHGHINYPVNGLNERSSRMGNLQAYDILNGSPIMHLHEHAHAD